MLNKDEADTSIRVWRRTRRRLKMLAAFLGESMIALIDRLSKQEADKHGISDEQQQKEQ